MWETPGVHAVKIARSAAEVLSDHTALELECPSLPERLRSSDRSGSVALFPPGATLCRPLMTPMTRCFVKDLERQQHEIVQAQRTQRTKEYCTKLRNALVCSVPSDDPVTGAWYPWLTNSTAMVNHIFDENFGPLFLKFCSYFPC